MPQQNGTGPDGQGAKSGRGLGPCGTGQAHGRTYGNRFQEQDNRLEFDPAGREGLDRTARGRRCGGSRGRGPGQGLQRGQGGRS